MKSLIHQVLQDSEDSKLYLKVYKLQLNWSLKELVHVNLILQEILDY